MKRIMSFEIFESAGQLTDEQVEFLNKHTKGTWKLNAEGKVDVEGDFSCSRSGLQNFKGLRFGTVSGSFYCSDNLLKSLEGAPETVGGGFYCFKNSLKSLEGAPETVDGGFYCSYNSLTSLEGAPETVGGDFNCSDNSLVSLEGAPETVVGNFYCHGNPLTSLEGAPASIDGDFYSSDNLKIPKGKWNSKGWLEALEKGNQKQKQLILTLISPEALNKRLQEDPEKTMLELKGIWNSPGFADTRSQLIIPKGLESEMDLLGDLDGIGL